MTVFGVEIPLWVWKTISFALVALTMVGGYLLGRIDGRNEEL